MFLLLATSSPAAFAGGPYTVTDHPAPISTPMLYASNEIRVTWYPAYPRVVVPASTYRETDFFGGEIIPSFTEVSGDLWHFVLQPSSVADAPYSEIIVNPSKRQVSVVINGKTVLLTRDPSGSRKDTELFLVSQDH